jgi:hypothetical protein
VNDRLRHLLPPLDANNRVPPVTAAGAWQPIGMADPLRVLATGLNSPERLRGPAADIVSVPDVWAQLKVFHGALSEPRHALHARAVGEWRGLVAVFALAAYRAPGLVCEVINLPDLPANRWTEIVRRLPPTSALAGNAPIESVALVRIDTTLVALAQPLTLLAPSRSLAALAAPPSVPWLIEGRFTDPLDRPVLAPDERVVLAALLDRLDASLEAIASDTADRGMLLGLVRGFRGELGAAPNRSSVVLHPVPATIALPPLPMFNALRLRERAEAPGAAPSDCLLRLRPEVAGSLKGIVLFDPRLDQLLGRPANELRIWRGTTLQMIQVNAGILAQVAAEAKAEGVLMLTSDEVFLPSLYRADGIDAENGFAEHPPALARHALPLSPIVLLLLSRPELARAIRLSDGGPAGKAVTLTLPLAAGGSVTLSRAYPQEEELEPPSALAIWPDLATPSWKFHLGYAAASPRPQFAVSTLLSDSGLQRVLTTSDGFSAVTAARGFVQGDAARVAEITWLRRDQNIARALHALPGPAQAAILEDRRAPDVRQAGLLLLPQPNAGAGQSGAPRTLIGIDFGTTNTAAYLRIGEAAPQPLLIAPRLIMPYSVSDLARDELDRELLPTTPVPMPFQTILKQRRSEAGGTLDAGHRPFTHWLVYFAQSRSHALETMRNDNSDLFADLKWSTDVAGRQRIEAFLAQVVILALAEAAQRGADAASVGFRFSFPEAFRPAQKSGFQAAARNAVRTGLELATGAEAPASPDIAFQTESIATARYFIHRHAAPATEGMITLDIGGQTTDVAILQSRDQGPARLAWRGSFELAGRHLLIDHLTAQPALLRTLARTRDGLARLVKALDDSAPAAAGEAARTLRTELVVNSPEFAEALQNVFPTLTDIAEADRLRDVALTGLAGLFDYTGRAVAHLVATDRITPRMNTAVAVCIGGRASLLFRALLQHHPELEAKVLEFLTRAAGDGVPMARLIFSAAPKEEVAFGLVQDDGSLTGQVPAEPLLGEAMVAKGASATAETLVGALDPARQWRIDQPREFLRFLGQLPELGVRAKAEPRLLAQLVGEANAELDRAMRGAQQAGATQDAAARADASAVEPPFVILLRRFVRHLAR